MNLKKEEVYLKITDRTQVSKVTELLDKFGEKKFSNIDVEGVDFWGYGYTPDDDVWQGINLRHYSGRTEVTIEQLEEILKPKEMKRDFKVGDKVKCIKNPKHEYGGAGWEEGKEVTVKNVDFSVREGMSVIWPEDERTYGIYAHSLELVTGEKQNTTKATPKNRTVTREALAEIYPLVCSGWKNRIEGILEKADKFSNTVEVPEQLVKGAYNEAYDNQREWLEKHLPKPTKTVEKELVFYANILKSGGSMKYQTEKDAISHANGELIATAVKCTGTYTIEEEDDSYSFELPW